jgi:hypothetical protein
MRTAVAIAASALALAAMAQAAAQAGPGPKPAELPVTRVVLYSSGVGYFEHRGRVVGDSLVSLPFGADEINDALKSLVVADGTGAGDKPSSPSVSYPSSESLDRALKNFRVDLSGAPALAELVARLRGAEISIDSPETVTGRIVSVERRPSAAEGVTRPFVLLLTKAGLKSVALDEAQVLRFSDPAVGEDFERALSLILSARDERSRSLEVRLPGTGSRQAALGYVIAAPVWKASYRLDLGQEKPQIQGWAHVDNPTGQDWKEVTLSLVSGRPVSFIQDLYAPLYLERPTIPLAIAGIAAARDYDSGFAAEAEALAESEGPAKAMKRAEAAPAMAMAPAPAPPSGMGGGFAKDQSAFSASSALETAQAQAAGDLFQFTAPRPMSLARGRSAMLPLIARDIAAERLSIYTAGSGRAMLGARLANDTGMRLPAGPVAVFDGGIYAGDALLDFFPEKDSRLVAFGEDLGLAIDESASSSQETVGVTVSKGVMTFAKRVITQKRYAFKNSTAQAKKVLVEHPIARGAELFEPKAADEKTDSLYRFSLALSAGGEASLVVKERSPRRETMVLSSMGEESFLAFSSSQEIPRPIREALKKALELRGKQEDSRRALAEAQAKREALASDQERYRSNLDAVGRDSSQGQQYLKRLMDAETAIDQTSAKIAEAQKAVKEAQAAYEGYLASLNL